MQMTVPARPKAPKLTADDLRELGIAALGHRRLLLEAIAVCLAESGRVEGLSGGCARIQLGWRAFLR